MPSTVAATHPGAAFAPWRCSPIAPAAPGIVREARCKPPAGRYLVFFGHPRKPARAVGRPDEGGGRDMQATTRVARFLLPLALALLISVTVAAQDVETAQEHQEQAAPAAEILERMGFGLHVGTTGIGLDVAYRALPWLTARLNGGYIGFDFEVSGADASFQLWNIGAVADIYPFEDDGFHVSAGLGYFDLSLTAEAEDAAAEGAEASLNSGPVGGYLGLGFGNVAAAQGLIGVTFDLGVILTGAKVEAAEDSGIDEILSSVGIDPGEVKEGFLVAWPVLSLGVSFRPGR